MRKRTYWLRKLADYGEDAGVSQIVDAMEEKVSRAGSDADFGLG
jgi:hypothetical protein